eukprot:gene3976-2077_t
MGVTATVHHPSDALAKEEGADEHVGDDGECAGDRMRFAHQIFKRQE